MTFLDFFVDPILRAPTIATMLMCLAASLVGVLVFIKKRSLLGESLSHAAYPGVTLAILCAGFFSLEHLLQYLVYIGAFLSALLGFAVIACMEKKLKVSADSALTAVLALFFGIGILVASFAQHAFSSLYRQMQTYLFGQAATMRDVHIVLYAILAAATLLFIFTFYKAIVALCFDPHFARSVGIANRFLEIAIFVIVVLTLVIGIRCVGVILMSAMLIAPASAARQFTNRLGYMFLIAALFGMISGFCGIYFSVQLSNVGGEHYFIPSGPMIVLVSGGIAVYALLFAPKRGIAIRYARILRFKGTCIQENLLKVLWRQKNEGKKIFAFKEIAAQMGCSALYLRFLLYRLYRQKALERLSNGYTLTEIGLKRGSRIVRLHRLWEAYLVSSLGLNLERVHKSAEEMEHILTPELEKKLTELLDDPKQDPHDQPIPGMDEGAYAH